MKQKIIKQRLLTVFLVLFINLISAQDKMGIITGKVTTSDNIPAEFINVFLKGTSYGTITTKDGSFTLKKVLEGEYTIQFSLIGLQTKLQKINVKSGKITNLNTITLSENQTKLDEIVINAQRLNQFAQKKTDYVTRLPLKNINTPQSYSIVSNELIKEQINIDLPSSLKSITGGGYIEANTGAVSVYARGFRGDARVKNGLLMYPRARTVIENQNIERIEVIKGPSAVNYGSGFYGGLINLVSKQPLTENKLDVSYIFGSFNLHRVTADFNKSVGKNNEYRFRVNGAFHKENEFQDNGSEIRKNFFIAPSFTYQPSEKLSVTINSEFLSSTRNLNFARGIGNNVTAKTWDDIKWDFNNTYTNQDVAGEMDYALVQLNANYKFTKNWASKTAISYTKFHAEGPYIRLNAISDTQIQREFLQFLPEKGGATNIRQDFVGNYTFSNIKNKTLVGVSYYSGFWNYTQKLPNGRGWFIPIDVIDVSLNEQVPAITMNQLNAITNYRTTSVESGNNTFAGYINNALTINEKITFLAGLRYDDFTNDATITDTLEGTDSYSQGKLSYNFGLSINPFNDQVSIYGNYMNGFNNAGPGKNENGDTQNFNPEEVKQMEVGLKFNLFNGKLKSTMSYYNIDIDNAILRYRGANGAYQKQDGKVDSNGFEFDIIANPFSGFNIVAGYTYNNAKNTKSSAISSDGKQLVLSPRTVANIWASYKFSRGKIKGLGIGFGANHMSQIFEARSVTNAFWAKPFTTLDGTIFYQKNQYRIGVKLNNITDKKYYNGYGIPQRPFNAVVALTYKL